MNHQYKAIFFTTLFLASCETIIEDTVVINTPQEERDAIESDNQPSLDGVRPCVVEAPHPITGEMTEMFCTVAADIARARVSKERFAYSDNKDIWVAAPIRDDAAVALFRYTIPEGGHISTRHFNSFPNVAISVSPSAREIAAQYVFANDSGVAVIDWSALRISAGTLDTATIGDIGRLCNVEGTPYAQAILAAWPLRNAEREANGEAPLPRPEFELIDTNAPVFLGGWGVNEQMVSFILINEMRITNGSEASFQPFSTGGYVTARSGRGTGGFAIRHRRLPTGGSEAVECQSESISGESVFAAMGGPTSTPPLVRQLEIQSGGRITGDGVVIKDVLTGQPLMGSEDAPVVSLTHIYEAPEF